MKKQIRKLLHRFENLKFRKKLSVLMLIVGLVPVVFLAFSMQYGMTNQLREKEQYNLEKILEQSVNSIENQSQIYENSGRLFILFTKSQEYFRYGNGIRL